jgi:hypothetical protein
MVTQGSITLIGNRVPRIELPSYHLISVILYHFMNNLNALSCMFDDLQIIIAQVICKPSGDQNDEEGDSCCFEVDWGRKDAAQYCPLRIYMNPLDKPMVIA